MIPADLIKHARIGKGWTQKQLADAVGVSAAFITKVENGQSFPSYERCIALANVLDLNVNEIWLEVEKARTEAFQNRMRARGKAVRTAFQRAEQAEGTSDTSSASSTADDIARDLAADPGLREAYRDLKVCLADPQMRETVLNALGAFAQTIRAK